MRLFPSRLFAFTLCGIISLAVPSRSDVPVPGNIFSPQTAAEAWNVIRLATRNVEQLLEENRPAEIPEQISFCSPALRALPRFLTDADAASKVDELLRRAFVSVNAIATAAQQNNPGGAKSALSSLRTLLDESANYFDPKAVSAEIYFCPMHPDFLSEDAKTPCPKCGMKLLPRRIPYSFIYTKPGEPTIRMTAKADTPVEAGKKIEVTIRMQKGDGAPVTPDSLIVVHAERIHLLIEERGLGDYHREHPTPTGTPGEYVFSFTPKKTVPYRIWADIVPVATGVQELPFVDLPSAGKGSPVQDTANRFTSSAGGYQFTLAFTNGNHLPTKAGQVRKMGITVTDPDGKPATNLEPVMNAFAHLVGFYDDYQTVVHLHPTGGDVINPDQRGGPLLGFILYPPKPGFMRLYCQASINGKMLLAPFNLNVEP